jgi:hypothetical protein
MVSPCKHIPNHARLDEHLKCSESPHTTLWSARLVLEQYPPRLWRDQTSFFVVSPPVPEWYPFAVCGGIRSCSVDLISNRDL